jgi:hypothetical protein
MPQAISAGPALGTNAQTSERGFPSSVHRLQSQTRRDTHPCRTPTNSALWPILVIARVRRSFFALVHWGRTGRNPSCKSVRQGRDWRHILACKRPALGHHWDRFLSAGFLTKMLPYDARGLLWRAKTELSPLVHLVLQGIDHTCLSPLSC